MKITVQLYCLSLNSRQFLRKRNLKLTSSDSESEELSESFARLFFCGLPIAVN